MYLLMKIKKDNAPVGTLAVDSIYTPVTKVNYQVEPARVGSMMVSTN